MARVLIVDDDGLILKAAQRLLERAGHEVWESMNPKTALHMLAHVQVDVVITDVYMPGMNGVELVRKLNDEHICPRLIAMTGGGTLNTPAEMLTRARLAGAGRTLQKPWIAGELEAAVADVLGAVPLN